MEQQGVVASWALFSKQQGASRDYGVLAASDDNVGKFVGKYPVGGPSSGLRPDAPLAAPWVTFGSHPTKAGRLLLSVSVQDRPEGNDQAGRAIWPRRFFLFESSQMAAAGASYQTLWEAIAPVTLPIRENKRVLLAPLSESMNRIAKTIEDIKFEWAAAIAAALLDGPVAVTGTGGLPPLGLGERSPGARPARLDRLALLDAIVALLPYNFRAELSVSSAVDNAIPHGVHLVLADYAKAGQQEALLYGEPVRPASPVAQRYLAALKEKRAGDDIEGIVAFLWRVPDACTLTDPEAALRIISRHNWLDDKLRFAEIEPEGLATSLAFFADFAHQSTAKVTALWQNPRFEMEWRHKMVRPLLLGHQGRGPDRYADAVLRNHWDTVSEDVATLVNRRLDDSHTDSAEHSLAVAGSLSPLAADRLLMMLLVPPPDPDPAHKHSLGGRPALLRDQPVPGTGSFELTCAVLRGGSTADWQGRIVADLLHDLIAAGSAAQAAQWVNWLCLSPVKAALPIWGEALRYVISGTGDASAGAEVQALVRKDTNWAGIVLALAAHTRMLPDLLRIPQFADDLLRLSLPTREHHPVEEENRQILASAMAAARFRQYGLGPGTLATVDAARLLLGIEPWDFPHDDQLATAYFARLMEIFDAEEFGNLRDVLEWAFLDALLMPGKRLTFGAVGFLLTLPPSVLLADYVVQEHVRGRLLRYRDLDAIWLPLVKFRPELKLAAAIPLLITARRRTLEAPREALARVPIEDAKSGRPGLSGTLLAHAMHDAMHAGMEPEDILAVLDGDLEEGRASGKHLDPRDFDSVLRELQHLLNVRPTPGIERQPKAGAEDILFDFQNRIVRGALGSGFRERFLHAAVERMEAERGARATRIKQLQREAKRRSPTERRGRIFGLTGGSRQMQGPRPAVGTAPPSQGSPALAGANAPSPAVPLNPQAAMGGRAMARLQETTPAGKEAPTTPSPVQSRLGRPRRHGRDGGWRRLLTFTRGTADPSGDHNGRGLPGHPTAGEGDLCPGRRAGHLSGGSPPR